MNIKSIISKSVRLSALSLICLFVSTSCSTPKNIAYFQDLSQGQTLQPQSVYDIRVRPEDKLAILVSTQDAGLSALFNLVQAQNRLTGNSATSNSYSSDSRGAYYTVNSSGDINFPILGTLHIAGMKRDELAQYIERRLMEKNLVKEPVVTVEFINTGVAVLGEVARPGRYEFNKDRITIMEALSMAGDLKNTGLRENVMVIRDVDGTKNTYIVDLTDAKSLAASPAYYLQQEDIIYVEPNERAKRETTSAGNTPFTPSFWLSVGSIGISLATLIVTLTR